MKVFSANGDVLYCYSADDNGGDTLFGDVCLEPYDPALPADEKPSAAVRPQPKKDEPRINTD